MPDNSTLPPSAGKGRLKKNPPGFPPPNPQGNWILVQENPGESLLLRQGFRGKGG
jgi:hypothetical protein